MVTSELNIKAWESVNRLLKYYYFRDIWHNRQVKEDISLWLVNTRHIYVG